MCRVPDDLPKKPPVKLPWLNIAVVVFGLPVSVWVMSICDRGPLSMATTLGLMIAYEVNCLIVLHYLVKYVKELTRA